ncbi:MAG: flagellar biosynthetic protein FliO [Acidobacteria bacterium]|nr:flagellar biosynthetic protein FliO [Acidobacteriota bacterium]
MTDGSVVVLFARLLVSLGVVLGLMWAIGRVLRARGFGGVSKPNAAIEVVARQSVNRTSSIALVRAAGKALIVSINESQISLLAEVDPAEIDGPVNTTVTTTLTGLEAHRTAPRGSASPRSSSPRKTLLEVARERTVRR